MIDCYQRLDSKKEKTGGYVVKITIGEQTAYLSDINESWINKALQELNQKGYSQSVGLEISTVNVNLRLMSPSLPSNGKGRKATEEEKQILINWKASKLDDYFSRSSLFRFLKDVNRLI